VGDDICKFKKLGINPNNIYRKCQTFEFASKWPILDPLGIMEFFYFEEIIYKITMWRSIVKKRRF